MAAVDRLEARLGWRFRDPALLQAALTHATYSHEDAQSGSSYERLEFLGDAVLGLLAAERVYLLMPAATEGELSRRRARAVRRETLTWLARDLDLAAYLRLGAGQRAQAGGASPAILADSFEAVAGALYLDGGHAAVQAAFVPLIDRAIAHTAAPTDFKTRLQEACHRAGLPPPVYAVTATQGPAHARQFVCAVHLAGNPRGSAAAASKKAAQQLCARQALEHLEPSLESA